MSSACQKSHFRDAYRGNRLCIINSDTTYRGQRVFFARLYDLLSNIEAQPCLNLRCIFDMILITDTRDMRDICSLFRLTLVPRSFSPHQLEIRNRRKKRRGDEIETAAFPRSRHLRIVKYPPWVRSTLAATFYIPRRQSINRRRGWTRRDARPLSSLLVEFFFSPARHRPFSLLPSLVGPIIQGRRCEQRPRSARSQATSV